MENYERFTEIQESAMNAEDASVLQYAKTLDSLESKLNQIRNSFQQFYMEIVNGPVIGEFLNIINNVITNLSQLPATFSIPKILSLIGQIRNAIQFIFTLISTSLSDTISKINQRKSEIFNTSPSWAQQLGEKIGEAIGEGIRKSNGLANAAEEQANKAAAAARGGTTSTPVLSDSSTKRSILNGKISLSDGAIRGLSLAGSALQLAGLSVSQDTMTGYGISNGLQIAGGIASTIAQAFVNPFGAVLTGVSTIATLVRAITGYEAKRLENLQKDTEKANIKRVEDKQAASDLQSYIEKEEKLRLARNDSAEAAQAYTDIQNEIAEKYPQYVTAIDESGNAIVNMASATDDLTIALNNAAASSAEWAQKARETAQAEYEKTLNTLWVNYNKDSDLLAEEPNKDVTYFQQAVNVAKLKTQKDSLKDFSEEEWFEKFGENSEEAINNLYGSIKQNTEYTERLRMFYDAFNFEDMSDVLQAVNDTKDQPIGVMLRQIITDTIGDFGQLFDYDTKTGRYSVADIYKEALSGYDKLLAANKTTLTQTTNSLRQLYSNSSQYTNQNKLFQAISGEETIITQMVSNKYTGKEDQYTAVTDYADIANKFYDFYNSIGEEAQIKFQEYLKDWQAVSLNDVMKLLGADFDRKAEDNDPVKNAIYDYFMGIWKTASKYVKDKLEFFAVDQDVIESLVSSLSTDQLTAFNNQLLTLKKQYEEGGDYAKTQIPKQIELLTKFYQNYSNVALSPELRTKFITNFGSSEWATSFSDKEIQALIDAGILKVEDSLDNYIYEQLNTYLNGTAERLADLATEFTSATDKQLGSGFTLKEAKELIQKFHLDSFDSAFVYDVFQGAYYLTNEAQQAMQDSLNDQVKNVQDYSETLKKLQVKNRRGFRTKGYADIYSQLTLQQKQAVDQARENATIDGVIDVDIYNKNLQDLIDAGQISINDATNQLLALNIKDIQTAEQYVNSKDKRTADAAKAYVEEVYDYATNLTGKVTADQISKLSTYGIDTTLIEVGDEWNKAIEYIGNERVKSIAKAAQAYSREEMETKLSSGLQDIFTSIVSGEEVAANDIADLVESALGRSLNSAERDAIEKELKESPQLLMNHLQAIITSSLRSQGVDEEEIQKILTELTITVVETISTAIEDGVSLLAKGITDGISQSELKQLSNFFKVSPDQIASYDQSTGKYRTSGEQFISTLTTSPIMKGRDTYAYSRQLTETLGGKDGVLGSYESITKEIERVEKNIKKCTDQEKARLKILKEMQAVYANIADSQRFDFMGYDMMQGQMDDFDNLIGSIQQVQDVFQGLSDSGGKMNYKNFLSMIDYIQKFHPDASGLQIAGQSLDQFAVAIMNTVDIAGNVDFSKVADAMTQGVGQMADAMKETLAEVARERIKTLEATKAALVAQLAVQKALKAGGKLPTIEWEGKTEKEGLKSIQKWKDTLNKQAKDIIDTMDDLTEEQKAASKAYLDSFPFGQQILDALGFKPEDMAKWSDEQKALFNQLLSSLDFGSIIEQAISSVQASGISFSNTEEFMAAFSMEFQRAVLKGWDENQPKEGLKLEAPNAKIVGDTQIEVPSTTTTTTISSEADNTTKALTDTATAISNAEEAFKNFGQTGQEEIGKIKTAITDLVAQLDSLKESFNLGSTETPMEIQLKAVIDEYTNATGVDPNKQVENLNATVGSFAPTAEGAASKAGLVNGLDATVDSFTSTPDGEASKKSLVDNLVATVERFLPAPGVDKNSLVSDLTALVNLSSNPEDLYKNIVAYMSAKKVSVAVKLANDGNEKALADLWGDLSPVEKSLVALKATSKTAAKTLQNVATNYALIGTTAKTTSSAVNTSETKNQEDLADTEKAVDNVSTKYGETSTAASNASTTIADAESANQTNIKKTGDAADIAKKRIADMARGEHKIKVNANTKPAIMAANRAVKDIEAKSATVTVTYTSKMTERDRQLMNFAAGGEVPPFLNDGNSGSSGGGSGGGGLWSTIKGWFGGGKYEGTVNDLGPAYAQGTKTLVGELGPELAVYDNAYHLLGRNGAELVDIPDDAIIFNHKQTEGILKGQANNGRGKTVNGQPAFATGNVDGPAYAGGLSGAITAIDREIMAWKALLSMTTADLLGSAGGGGGGGGSGNTLKAHIEDLVEWYNLTRQIADIEQKINNIIAKRANITDGRAYLKSLREQQHLLEGQALVQKTLLGYQQKQLELQAEQINTHDIWKQFFHVGSDGLLQYNMGNEVNGGKGTLTLLQQLNQMSGADQLSYIKSLGYSYITNDGEQLDGEDLISQFFEEAQAQIDKYDELRDTVESTDEALSKLESSINEIEQEIRDNQKELEEIIYNTLVEAWEKQISQLQEQTDMLREANEAYVNGLNDALNKERNQYSQNKSISDRQQLQRQLSLLRRSGGSASQIASLEEQLNSALKEEYFSHQQETIDSIKEANDKQLDALNKQITLQQETLDFQKENGVLWTKVYEVLAQSDGKIMEFLIQNSSEFIQASALAQADMLNEEWAKRIGIYKANSEEGFEPYVQKANQMFATEAWNSAEGPQKQSMFNALDVASQKALQDYFASAFANEMLRNGGNEAGAYEVARQDMYQKLYQAYNQMKNIQNTTLDAIRNISQPSVAPKDNVADSGGGAGGGGGNTSGDKDGSGSSKKQWLRITYRGLVTTGNSKGKSNGGSPSGPSSLEVGKSGAISWNCYPGFVQGGFDVSDTSKCSVSGSTITALASGSVTITLKYWDRTPKPAGLGKATTTVKNDTNSSSSTTKTGGGSSGKALLKKNLFANSIYAASGAFIESDDTPAILHKGEGVFTASETSALRSMVKNYQTLAANLTGNSLLSAMSGIGSYSFSNTRNAGSELNINPGAVVIHVDKLDDKYDVDELATDVFNKLSAIASKATNRGVNRR